MEKNLKKNIYVHIYVLLNHFAVNLKYCKSTILQLKKNKKVGSNKEKKGGEDLMFAWKIQVC